MAKSSRNHESQPPYEMHIPALLAARRASFPSGKAERFAVDVFGSAERAESWMNEPNPALGGLTPLNAVAAKRQGEVIQVLGRIQSGVLS